ncbi:hypothetical protein AB0O95_02875 [Rhodoglobus sp. NPDC076762]
MSNNRDGAYGSVNQLATWSEWAPFADAAALAPRTPGVYQMRIPGGTIVYVGMAGERRGQGIRGRLSIYRRGKGAVSGFGEAALDRALADATFIEEHLAAVRNGQPSRTSGWARDAIALLEVEVRWAECATGAEAGSLEDAAVALLSAHGIWNRVAAKARQERSPNFQTNAPDNATTVRQLTAEYERTDQGRMVRAILRAGFPEHPAGHSWDPLSSTQAGHVRATLGPTPEAASDHSVLD